MSVCIWAKHHVKNKHHQASRTVNWRKVFLPLLILSIYLPSSPWPLTNKTLPFPGTTSRPPSAYFTPALEFQPVLSPPVASRSPLFHSSILSFRPLRQPKTPCPPRVPNPTSQAGPGWAPSQPPARFSRRNASPARGAARGPGTHQLQQAGDHHERQWPQAHDAGWRGFSRAARPRLPLAHLHFAGQDWGRQGHSAALPSRNPSAARCSAARAGWAGGEGGGWADRRCLSGPPRAPPWRGPAQSVRGSWSSGTRQGAPVAPWTLWLGRTRGERWGRLWEGGDGSGAWVIGSARGCSLDPIPPGRCLAELSTPGQPAPPSPERPGASSHPRPAEGRSERLHCAKRPVHGLDLALAGEAGDGGKERFFLGGCKKECARR